MLTRTFSCRNQRSIIVSCWICRLHSDALNTPPNSSLNNHQNHQQQQQQQQQQQTEPSSLPPPSPSSSSSKEPAAASPSFKAKSLRELREHLNTHHRISLQLDCPRSRKQISAAARSSLLRIARQQHTTSFSFHPNGRSFRAVLCTLLPWSVPESKRSFPTTTCRDASFLLSKWVTADAATGKEEERDERKQYSCLPCRRLLDVVLIDFANTPEIFSVLDSVDPGAELFLRSPTSTKVIVVKEPRAQMQSMHRSSWARSLLACGDRLACCFCERCKESGDITMCDLVTRIRECVIQQQQQQQQDNGGFRLRFHIVSNDLRHRRALRDVFHSFDETEKEQVEICGMHAFGGTSLEWQSTMRELLGNLNRR